METSEHFDTSEWFTPDEFAQYQPLREMSFKRVKNGHLEVSVDNERPALISYHTLVLVLEQAGYRVILPRGVEREFGTGW